jgi:orotate phosphoribosyltransferase
MPIPIKRIRRGSMNHKLREASILDETDLARDSVALAGFIAQRWPEVDGIAGVPRSGMIAGSIVATTLGVPLYELYQGQLRRLGGGRRMRRHLTKPEGTSIVAVEDSINTGWSMGRAVSKTPDPRVIGKTAVYCTPTGTSCVDLYAVALPLPHYFTWHMFGANVLCRQPTGFDMDGIYCTDCEREDDDDGERYLNWMRSVRPYRMYVGGKATAIVTSRLEKYRDETVQWFARYGLEYGQLVMGPWASLAERRSSDVGAWKASVARDLRLEMFVESSERQARSIAALAQIPVFCPKTKSIYTP